jgi:hypothetical protein
MGPDGKYLKFFSKNANAQEVYDGIVQAMTPPNESWWVTFKKAFNIE